MFVNSKNERVKDLFRWLKKQVSCFIYDVWEHKSVTYFDHTAVWYTVYI